MSVTQSSGSVVVQPGQQMLLSSLFTLGSGLPSIIGINLLDDGNYTKGNPGALGYLAGNGATSSVNLTDSIGKTYSYEVFQYDPNKGEYYNASLGYWNDITVVAPTGNDHATLLTVFSFKSGTALTQSNLNDLGDLSIVTENAFTNPFPAANAGQATPNEIAAIAQTYVGKVWNGNGCALLVQIVSGLSGANVPFTELSSSASPQNPFLAQASGEWMVAYDGEAQANPSVAAVEALIRPGDIVNLGWQAGGGHTTTVVSGSGANALVVDNMLDVSAHDGDSSDYVIQPPHSLDAVLKAGIPSTIQVYRLDTPVLTAQTPAAPLAALSGTSLSNLFSAADPAGKAISQIQLYDSAAGNSFIVNGASQPAHSAASAITVGSLDSVTLKGGAAGGSDVVAARAYNGAYWGDWQTVTLSFAPALTAAQAIVNAAPGQTVLDTAQNVLTSLDGLARLAGKGELSSIGLTDGAIPNLSLGSSQFSSDSAALNAIATAHTVTVQMTGSAVQHDFSAENWRGASALQFSDQTVIVAAAPGNGGAVTTGNITELYSAVLAREPDIGGLAYYQNFLAANPSTPLQNFAEFFLSSSEYTTAHAYPQSVAGDQQFIADSYNNLLHRAPSASEVSFYETNVLAPAVAGLTAGTQAYASAQLQAHALMLVYFSASSEFLGDVQITASNHASASHWLLLT